MTHDPNSHNLPLGIATLCQDLATLVNNRRGSDIQFKVGGNFTSNPKENEEAIYDDSTTVTLYAHSLILRCRSRYFAAMLDEDNHWKESSNGVIYKPNVSPSTFQDILYYIYTGKVRAKSSDEIMELITSAEEMDLDELSTECQIELVRIVKDMFPDEDDTNNEYENEETSEGSIKQQISIDIPLRTYGLPALNFASSHFLPYLTQKLQEVILPHMSIIIKSPDAYTTFVSEISPEAFSKVIASDSLAITERSVWDLAISWACHQTNLSKTAVEARLSNLEREENDEESSNVTAINSSQLNILKETVTPLLPFIRFSLLDPEDYSCMVHTLSYFLPLRRFSGLALFIFNPDGTKLPDTPREETFEQSLPSKIVIDYTSKKFLKKTIFNTGEIAGCRSIKHIGFKLLFRASEHGFIGRTFHERCDYKGPTLVLVKSADGHLFGGVNFAHWSSDDSYARSPLNFLFALPDGRYRENLVIFTMRETESQYSTYNHPLHGPTFGGGHDLQIANVSNTNQNSYSGIPYTYDGDGASNTALAGDYNFTVSDYEVFAISKK